MDYASKIAFDAVRAETDRLLGLITPEQLEFFGRVLPKYPDLTHADMVMACGLVHRTVLKNQGDAGPDAFEHIKADPDQRIRFMHIKRGSTYRMVGRGRIQTGRPLEDYDEVTIYESEETGDLWVRPNDEFDDPTRFIAIH